MLSLALYFVYIRHCDSDFLALVRAESLYLSLAISTIVRFWEVGETTRQGCQPWSKSDRKVRSVSSVPIH